MCERQRCPDQPGGQDGGQKGAGGLRGRAGGRQRLFVRCLRPTDGRTDADAPQCARLVPYCALRISSPAAPSLPPSLRSPARPPVRTFGGRLKRSTDGRTDGRSPDLRSFLPSSLLPPIGGGSVSRSRSLALRPRTSSPSFSVGGVCCHYCDLAKKAQHAATIKARLTLRNIEHVRLYAFQVDMPLLQSLMHFRSDSNGI